MKPRCQGHHDGGLHTSFLCVLDEGHDGFCEPYVPPTVEEWRRVGVLVANLRRDIAACAEAVGGCLTHEQTGHGAENAVQAVARFAAERREDEQTLWQMRKNDGAMIRQLRADNDRLQAENDVLRAIIESGRDLDAEVVAGVQAGQTARKPGP